MLKMILTSIGITIVLFGLGYYFFGLVQQGGLKTNKFLIGSKIIEVEIADTVAARARGLSYRDSLGENNGLYFIFDSPGNQAFWMKDMNFPIDIIWIKDDKIVGVAENVMPQPGAQLWQLKSYSSPVPVNRVLEVNAGWFAKNGIKIGDEAKLTDG